MRAFARCEPRAEGEKMNINILGLNVAEIFLLMLAVALGALVSWLFRRLKKTEERLAEFISIVEKKENGGTELQ